MKTKIVQLKSGERLVLYFSEENQRWISDKDTASDPFYKYVIIGKSKQARVIRNFYYESTTLWTKNKIKLLVNEEKNGFERAYAIVVEALINREK